MALERGIRHMIRWDKTQKTWHTNTKAGRYSVRRTAKRAPYGAYLNNKLLPVDLSSDVDVVKRAVELRIIEARRIAQLGDDDGKEGACADSKEKGRWITARFEDAKCQRPGEACSWPECDCPATPDV